MAEFSSCFRCRRLPGFPEDLSPFFAVVFRSCFVSGLQPPFLLCLITAMRNAAYTANF
uniref:Uncharacterized protein n=1 Tax=Anguilla anguilla TaxID=7936 RepID=A0A0E9RAV5_ANGAN